VKRGRHAAREPSACYSLGPPASATGQVDVFEGLKQLPDVTSQQLMPPFGAAGQLVWQSESWVHIVGQVCCEPSSPLDPLELPTPFDGLPELEPLVASYVAPPPSALAKAP
jgi:hypothetical protein